MRSPFFALAAASVVLFAACDASSPIPQAGDGVTINASTVGSGDILYDLEPFAIGEVFTATLDVGDSEAVMHTERTASGYAETFSPPAGTQSVRVFYLFEGTEVGESFEVEAPGPIYSGSSEDQGDSYHWRYDTHSGVKRLYKDHDRGDLTGIDGEGIANGTILTTPSGDQIRVTHIGYELIGLPDLPLQDLRFESPSPFEISSVTLR